MNSSEGPGQSRTRFLIDTVTSQLMPKPSGPPDEFRTAVAVQIICLAIAGTTIITGLHDLSMGHLTSAVLSFIIAAIMPVVLWLNRHGNYSFAIRLAVWGILANLTAIMVTAPLGIHGIGSLSLPGLLVCAAITTDFRFFVRFAIAEISAVSAIVILQIKGVTHCDTPSDYGTLLNAVLILGLTALAAGLLVGNLRSTLAATRETAAQLAAANHELSLSEGSFRSMIELAVDAIFRADPAGRIIEVNRRAVALTGYERSELIGMPLDRLLAPSTDSVPLSNATLDDVLAFDGVLECTSGDRIPVEIRATRLDGGDIQSIWRDVSDRKQAEEQLRHAQKMESLGRLAGGVAHDFNNLLTVINGYSSMMLDTLTEDNPARPSLHEIHSAGDRAAQLTKQLLAFSRRQEVKARPVAINEIVADGKKMLGRLLGEDIELETVLDPAAGMILADPSQIDQILLNLAVNARDAMPHGGRVSIATATADFDAEPATGLMAGRYVVLTFADTGAGMSEEIRQRVFEPFFTTKPVGTGTGLGLSIVYGIVSQNRGSVTVESTPGKGTAFQILLPAVHPGRQIPDVKETLAARCGSETVLVVEDQAEVRRFAVDVLEGAGYRALEADSGAAALDMIAAMGEPVHLVLSDVVMPRMSGLELSRRLRAVYPETRVLLVSGYSEEAFGHDNAASSASLLTKPFSPAQLTTRIREILDQPRVA